MKMKTHILKPTLRAFFGTFILALITFFTFRVIIATVNSPNAIELKIFDWWLWTTLLAVGLALGTTFGVRKHQLSIANTKDSNKLYNWIVQYMSINGSQIEIRKECETNLRSVNRFNQLFDNWFETESISVKLGDDKIVIKGPNRKIDKLERGIRSHYGLETKNVLELSH
ncbi:hypothetical protein [Tunicatimonas sp.]|uniref:hypothetical protein n=1 Tax=Tunicatimonas sp. TaxID=1940096 RepID=UPI003C723575